MRQKIPYGIFGFLCGMFASVFIGTPIAQFITGKQQNPITGSYFFLMILVFGIIGVFVGLKVDKFMNDKSMPDIVHNDQNFITKYLNFISTSDRRIEGNYIIYTTSQARIWGIAVIVLATIYLTARYLPNPYGNSLSWIIVVLSLMTQIPQGRDKMRAISKKLVTNAQGKKEIWYEMPHSP